MFSTEKNSVTLKRAPGAPDGAPEHGAPMDYPARIAHLELGIVRNASRKASPVAIHYKTEMIYLRIRHEQRQKAKQIAKTGGPDTGPAKCLSHPLTAASPSFLYPAPAPSLECPGKEHSMSHQEK